tara:strand:+ start:87 stop:293 length:207 start_codon:yes stop_codon:yes gene_type:complete
MIAITAQLSAMVTLKNLKVRSQRASYDITQSKVLVRKIWLVPRIPQSIKFNQANQPSIRKGANVWGKI